MRLRDIGVGGFAIYLACLLNGMAANAATLTPLGAFGGGDGWRAPYEVLSGDDASSIVPDPSTSDPRYRYLGNALTGTSTASVNAGNFERGLAYNPSTGHVLLVSRNGASGSTPGIRILDGTTGADLGQLNQGTGVIGGGTFAMNMIGVGDDGAIYMSNLTTASGATTPYKVYRWANESATPTVAYDGASTQPLPGARMGDTFDVIGSGANTRLIAGYSNSPSVPGNNSFALFTTGDGSTYTANNVTLTASGSNPPSPAGNFRLGMTFQDSDTIIGKSDVNAASVVNLSSTTAGSVDATFSTDGISLKPMDFAVVAGKPIIAMIEATNDTTTARARLFVYDMSDLSAPLAQRQIAVGTTLPMVDPGNPTQFANGNATGQVKFGDIENNVATIYAMSTNNGIEAFTLTLDLTPVASADFNGDGIVDGADFLTWQQNQGTIGGATQGTGDANTDGNVDQADLAVWQSQFGASPSVSAVPEPAAGLLCILLLTWLAAFWRRF